MKSVKTALFLILLAMLGAGAFVWSGQYNPGADSPHWKITSLVLQAARERSVEQRAETIAVPGNLDDPEVILKGAGQYAAMCTSCHLAPGMKDTELRPGLYPRPPNLSEGEVEPREAFWIIKHGLKMTAMPAWGLSHDDATIWSMVAFLQKLPGMTAAQYKEMVAKAPPDEDMEPGAAADSGDHAHDGDHGHAGD